jgi:hypothetical protein
MPSAKINFKTLSYFPTPQKRPPAVHVYHAIHHNFTTIYHGENHHNRQNPLQKAPFRLRNFFRPLNSKKTGCMMTVANDFVPS